MGRQTFHPNSPIYNTYANRTRCGPFISFHSFHRNSGARHRCNGGSRHCGITVIMSTTYRFYFSGQLACHCTITRSDPRFLQKIDHRRSEFGRPHEMGCKNWPKRHTETAKNAKNDAEHCRVAGPGATERATGLQAIGGTVKVPKPRPWSGV